MAGMTRASLDHAISAVLATLETEHEGLTALDGKLGDGDLGITLLKAFRQLDTIRPDLPEDLGQAFMQCAQGVMKVSSSSFGTLLATGLMTAAKTGKGWTELDWAEVPDLLHRVVEALAARGRSALGQKTVLDALDAAATAAEGKDSPRPMLQAAREGIDSALDTYRDKPNQIGRARVYAERSVGMDDPGMVALKVMAGAL